MIVKHTLITVLGEAGALQKCLPANWKPVIPDLMRDDLLVRKKAFVGEYKHLKATIIIKMINICKAIITAVRVWPE